MKTKIKEHEGEVVDLKGEVIGKHKGVEFYTIGQRHGFEVKAMTNKSEPLFVVSKDKKSNQLVVGEKDKLFRDSFEVDGWSFIREGYELTRKVRNHATLLVRIRHGGKLVEGRVNGKRVQLNKKVFGVASGQVAALYRQEECLGGGVIKG